MGDRGDRACAEVVLPQPVSWAASISMSDEVLGQGKAILLLQCKLPDSRSSCSESYLEKPELYSTLQASSRELGLPCSASPTAARSWFPSLDGEAVTCSRVRMLAPSLLSPRLCCGAGGVCPAWGGGSRTQHSPAASGPFQNAARPQGSPGAQGVNVLGHAHRPVLGAFPLC